MNVIQRLIPFMNKLEKDLNLQLYFTVLDGIMSMVDEPCPICEDPETQCEHWESRKPKPKYEQPIGKAVCSCGATVYIYPDHLDNKENKCN